MKLESLSEKKKKLEKQGKKNNIKNQDDTYTEGFQKGIEASFSSIQDTMKAYQYYKDDVKKLMEEQKSIWKQWIDFYEKKNSINRENYIESYNDWLLSYLFINEENKCAYSLLSF